jgi:hypothetical protein
MPSTKLALMPAGPFRSRRCRPARAAIGATRRRRVVFFRKAFAMLNLIPGVAAVTVSTIYCLWRSYHQVQVQRQRLIRERVAYMLWVVAMRCR